jgi:allantoate deiminase
MDAVAKILERLESLGGISEEQGRLTRRFATPALRQANDLAGQWMQEAGMSVRQDAIGNLIGHYPGTSAGAKILMLGSHLDTVPNAGKFDGALGVVLAIACVEKLAGRKLPFAIEVAAFADEEGTRYHTSYLGSRAMAGEFLAEALNCIDKQGIEMRAALRQAGGDPNRIAQCRADPARLLGYAEVHIEQGPVLELKKLAVGVVTAIAGQTRASVTFEGKAGHAGTTPMRQRQDALVAAARFILEVERHAKKRKGLVATVGQLTVLPGASNVIPGQATLTLDVRHEEDAQRLAAVKHFQAALRNTPASWKTVSETPTVHCSPAHVALMRKATRRHQPRVLNMVSGAGHDAAMMAQITPVAMLFVHCRNGLSHHPDEMVAAADLGVALAVLSDYINEFI